jgi:hypothetical protein
VFRGERPARLQFHDEARFDEKVCVIISEQRSILIVHGERVLLLDLEAALA